MQGLMFDSQLLLHSLLWRTERLFAEKQIITRLGPGDYHRYTYREFGRRARRLGDALRTLDVALALAASERGRGRKKRNAIRGGPSPAFTDQSQGASPVPCTGGETAAARVRADRNDRCRVSRPLVQGGGRTRLATD